MKINDILSEGKFSKPSYAYHVTTRENLPSIIKHGLVPNFKEEGYGSDDFGPMGYSQKSLPGLYLTTTSKDAVDISRHMPHPVILVCKAQIQSSEMDEDYISTKLLDERGLMNKIEDQQLENGEYPDDFDETELAKETVNKIFNTKLNHLDKRALDNVYPTFVEYVETLINFYIDGSQNDSYVKDLQHELTRKLKLLTKSNKLERFKIDKPITFSGANRIVGIYDKENEIGWGDLGPFEKWPYHKVKAPLELIKSKNSNKDNQEIRIQSRDYQ